MSFVNLGVPKGKAGRVNVERKVNMQEISNRIIKPYDSLKQNQGPL